MSGAVFSSLGDDGERSRLVMFQESKQTILASVVITSRWIPAGYFSQLLVQLLLIFFRLRQRQIYSILLLYRKNCWADKTARRSAVQKRWNVRVFYGRWMKCVRKGTRWQFVQQFYLWRENVALPSWSLIQAELHGHEYDNDIIQYFAATDDVQWLKDDILTVVINYNAEKGTEQHLTVTP